MSAPQKRPADQTALSPQCRAFARRCQGKTVPGPVHIPQAAALRAKIRPDEAQREGCGGSTVERENEVWPDFHPQPGGTWPIFPISLSLVASVDLYSALLAPRTRENWRSSLSPEECEQALQQLASREVPNQRLIRCQKVIRRQLPQLAPQHALKDIIGQLARESVHREKLQVHRSA